MHSALSTTAFFAMLLGQSAPKSESREHDKDWAYAIDFSPFEKSKEPYRANMALFARAKAGESFKLGIKAEGQPGSETAESNAYMLKYQFQIRGWQVRKLNALEVLVVGKNEKPVEIITLETNGLEKQFHPIVRKVPLTSIKPAPVFDANVVVDFREIDALGALPGTGIRFDIESADGAVFDRFVMLDGKYSGEHLSLCLFQTLAGDFDIRHEGSRVTILSVDGRKGKPCPIRRISVYFAEGWAVGSLPAVIASDNVKVERDVNPPAKKR